MILAIDPGTTESGWVAFAGPHQPVARFGFHNNEALLGFLRARTFNLVKGDSVVVEMIASYGMPVGKEVFQTVLMIGRIMEICYRQEIPCRLVFRQDVKLHLCKSPKAKDANVSQSLRDKYGEKGTKKKPGPLFGIAKHTWSALAVADYAYHNPEVV